MTRGRRLAAAAGLAAAVAALAWPAVATARVFWRFGSGDGEGLARRLSGRLLYEAVVEADGGATRVAAIAMDGSAAAFFRQRARQAAEALGRVVRRTAQAGSERIDVEAGARRVTLLTLATPGGDPVLLAVDRPAAAAAEVPARAAPDGVPAFPGAVPLCYMNNRSSGAALASSRTPAAPETVRAFYALELGRQGWAPAWGRARDGAAGVMLYQRGRGVCCVYAHAEAAGGSRIDVLTRGLAE